MIPKSVIDREKVQLSGGWVEVRGLSVAEMETVRKLSGAKQNILSISFATGEPHAEVESWYLSDETSAADVGKLCDTIARLSGLTEGAQFPRAKGNDAVVEPTAT